MVADARQLRGGFPWHEVGASGEPAFQNSWVNRDSSTYRTAAFMKDPLGIVHLKGQVSTGSIPGDIFRLPEGFRPALHLTFATSSNAAYGELQIGADGDVNATAGSNTGFSLEGITFKAEA